MSSILFKRFKSKGPEFKGQKLAYEKSRGTDKTLKRHIIQFNSIHAFISDKSPYYTGYINYNHRLLIIN